MLRALLITIVGSSFISCLTGPLIFDGLKLFFPDSRWPFSRVFDRVFLGYLLIFIIVFKNDFNLKVIHANLSALSSWRARMNHIGWGFMVTFLSVALCGADMIAGDFLAVHHRPMFSIAKRLFLTIPTAICIAAIEECFFRVLLFSRLRECLSFWIVALVTSSLYALVHFVSPDKTFIYRGDSWLEGFGYVPALIHRILEPGTGIGMFGLFIVGLILALAYERFSSVYLVIGLHAGWITALKMISYVSWRNPLIVSPAGLTGRYALFCESQTWVSFLLVLMCLGILSRARLLEKVE